MNINSFRFSKMFLIIILYISFLFISLPFFPLLTFCLTIIYLLFFCVFNSDLIRIFISIISYSCLIVILGSKSYVNELSMDLSIYSNVISGFDSFSLIDLWLGSFVGEPGWVTLYWILDKIGFHVQGIQLAITNTIICLILFMCWFEKYAIKEIPNDFRGIVTATTILFMSVVTFGFLQRQSLSVVILLFALSNRNNKYFYFYLFISSLFHISSLFIGLIYKFLFYKTLSKNFWISFFSFFIIVRTVFSTLVSFLLDNLPFPVLAYKLNFYAKLNEFQIVSWRLAFYGLFFSIITLFFSKNLDIFHKNLVRFCSVVFISMMGVNLFSERFNFILLYCFGLYISLMLYKKYSNLLICICFALLIIFVFEKGVLTDNLDPFWQRYDYISSGFFYYLSRI